MAIYVVQHGKNLAKDKDPEKSLSHEGQTETERIAKVAKGYNIKVSMIVHSGIKRAGQTAEILASYFNPENGVSAVGNMNPLSDAVDFSRAIEMDKNIMFVGHLPFLERLVSYLVTGRSDNCIFKIQNSGILCLDKFDPYDHPVIKWGIMPNIS